jgi:phospholipid/cholesterol/gamma-HCH transport system substrate-binding protein
MPRAETLRTRLLGAVFALVLVTPLVAAVLAARGAFAGATATVLLDEAARHPRVGSDVTLAGMTVGRVLTVAARGHGAAVALRLDRALPTAVVARLLPRTLIGDVYLELVPDPGGSRDGDGVIRQDHSQAAVELQRMLDTALPLLRAVDPAKVAGILRALGMAVDGRGPALGEAIDRLGRLLPAAAAQLPALRASVRSLAAAADADTALVPDLVRALTALADLPVRRLAGFVASATRAADATADALDQHGDRLIQLATGSRATLELLARYSPEYGCVLRGLAEAAPRLRRAFDGGLHVTFELARPRRPYAARPTPAGTGAGPDCHGLPRPAVAAGSGGAGTADAGGAADPGTAGPADLSGTAEMGMAGTAEEDVLLRPVVAAAMGRPVERVPDIAGLLVGPLARGTVVEVS